MDRTTRILAALLLFNGATAVFGGLALMTGWIPAVTSWVEHTDFPGNYLFWIVGEIASIRGFHVLQVVYVVTGGLVVLWTPGRRPARVVEGPEISGPMTVPPRV